MAWQLFSVVFKCNVYGDQPKRDEGNEVSGIELAWLGSCLAEFLSVMYTAPNRSNCYFVGQSVVCRKFVSLAPFGVNQGIYVV